MIQLTHEHTCWELADDLGPLLPQVLATPSRVVKESPAKQVTEHRAGGRSFFVKRYRHAAVPLRPLKFFFKASQARKEWRLADILEERRIPIVRHVALGERWNWRGLEESILITEAFAGVTADLVRADTHPQLMAFVERLAAAGAVHRDFHPANLLLNESTGEIRLLDLHGLEIVPGTSADQRRDEMLAQLCITLALPVTREVAARGLRLRKDALAARARRCLKSNRDFARKRIGPLVWHLRASALNPASETALRDPDRFIAAARMLKAGRSSTVAAADGIVIKRYNFRRWLRPLKDLFRESRARSAFRKAYHLELAGVPTARVMAAADERVLGLVRRGFLVIEEIPGATDIGHRAAARADAAAVGRLIGRLHREGFSHRDLKATNIVFDEHGQPHLIDLEGLRFDFDVPHSTAAANLRRLAEGAADCGRLDRAMFIAFLRAYCRARALRPRQLFPRA